ncbi:hypothetical protein KKD61_03460, partial [Patescibacteria group bacterium]|nr:hypothetical protein [Patescibacteria group bacterium]
MLGGLGNTSASLYLIIYHLKFIISLSQRASLAFGKVFASRMILVFAFSILFVYGSNCDLNGTALTESDPARLNSPQHFPVNPLLTYRSNFN